MNQNLKSIITLDCAGLIYIENKKLLLAYSNNKACFYLPGGKVDHGESATEALCREVAEELDVTIIAAELEFYMHVTAPAYGEKEGIVMEQDCFFLHKLIQPVATAEVAAIKYFSLEEYLAQKIPHRVRSLF